MLLVGEVSWAALLKVLMRAPVFELGTTYSLQGLPMSPWNRIDKSIINRILFYLLIRNMSRNVPITFMPILSFCWPNLQHDCTIMKKKKKNPPASFVIISVIKTQTGNFKNLFGGRQD